MDYLRRTGFDTVSVGKPYPRKAGILRAPQYAGGLLAVFLKVFWKLATDRSIGSVHISGFYLHLIYHEYALIALSRLMGKRVVYELRGSGVERGYDHRSLFYRFFFRQAVARSHAVLSQGSRYLPFLRRFTDRNVLHYPNCNELYRMPRENPDETVTEAGEVRLVYFGRIVASKRPDLAIRACHDLCVRGINARLSIVGEGEEGFLQDLKSISASLGDPARVDFLPAVEMAGLIEILARSHFFVFPSAEPREGQSNALTEAMGMGGVPIVSGAGFNREIVGDASLVVAVDGQASAYSDIMHRILTAGDWRHLSAKARGRVALLYSEDVALAALRDAHTAF